MSCISNIQFMEFCEKIKNSKSIQGVNVIQSRDILLQSASSAVSHLRD